MLQLIKTVLLVASLCAAASAAAPPGTTELILAITVNGQPKGEFFMFRTADGDYLVRRDDLHAMGLAEVRADEVDVEGEGYASLRATRGIQVRLDERALTLHISASPDLFGSRAIDMLPGRRPSVLRPRDTSAFVNYGLRYSHANGSAPRYELATEIGARAGSWLLLTGSSHVSHQEQDRSVRLMTSLTLDRRAELQRLVIGDFFATPIELGSALTLGGVSFSKKYSIDPYVITHPTATLAGAVSSGAEAKIYVDGLPIKTEALQPGEFMIQNLNYYGGARDIRVVIKDVFGREQQYTYQYYFTDALLRAGLQDYSYSIGRVRHELGAVSNSYGPLAASFFHRRGLTDDLTVGLRGEAAEGRLNVGPQASARFGNFGVTVLSMAASRDETGATGQAAQLGYGYQSSIFSARFSARRMTRHYAVAAGVTPLEHRSRSDINAGFGYGAAELGNLGIDYSRSNGYARKARHATTVSYSRSLGRDWNLFATVRRVQEVSGRTEFFLGLTWYPTREVSVSYGHENRLGVQSQTYQVQKNAPLGEGWGYRVAAERTGPGSANVSPFLQYNGRTASYSADLNVQTSPTGRTETRYGLAMSGGIGYAGGAVGLSRPISDSFAVVQVANLPNVRVYQSNQVVGVTDKSGAVYVPNLASYADNQIAIEDTDIPPDYLIATKEKYVSPPLRSGSVVRFDVVRIQAFTGTLRLRKGDALEPVENRDGSVDMNGRSVPIPTGKNGVFYVENLLPGSYAVTMPIAEGTCKLQLTVPETAEPIVDLGNLICEPVR